MKKQMKKEKRLSGIGYLLLAAVAIAIGICFFAFGQKMLETLALLIGIIVTLTGTVLLAITLARRARGLSFGARIVIAVAILSSGICTMILRNSAIEILTNIFSLLIIVDGAFKLNTAVLAYQDKEHSGSFIFLIAISFLTIGCGFLSITYVPYAYMLGAGMFADAVANIFSAFYIPYLMKKLLHGLNSEKEVPIEETEAEND